VVFELELAFNNNYLVLLVVMSVFIEAACFVFAGVFLPEGDAIFKKCSFVTWLLNRFRNPRH
jgi:hypothetical protein